MWNLKHGQMNLSTKQKHGHREQTFGCQVGGEESEMDWDLRVDSCKLLHLEWVSSEVLL